MSYPLRRILPGRLYGATTRTLHARLLLRPSELLNTIVKGIIALAAKRYGVKVCYFVVMSNHVHLLVIPETQERMRAFMNFVNGNLAQEAGKLHGWREKFWSRCYRLIEISDEPEAQVSRLRYLLAHGCKEKLVKRPNDWPGASALQGLLGDQTVTGHWFDRTAEYHARRRGEKVTSWDFASLETLEIEPLPCWSELDSEQRKHLVEAIVDEIEESTRQQLKESGESVLGARRVLRQDPHSTPNAPKKSPAPLYHAHSLESWLVYKEEWDAFRANYRDTVARLYHRLVLGLPIDDILFPAGSFPPTLPLSLTEQNRLANPPPATS